MKITIQNIPISKLEVNKGQIQGVPKILDLLKMKDLNRLKNLFQIFLTCFQLEKL